MNQVGRKGHIAEMIIMIWNKKYSKTKTQRAADKTNGQGFSYLSQRKSFLKAKSQKPYAKLSAKEKSLFFSLLRPFR